VPATCKIQVTLGIRHHTYGTTVGDDCMNVGRVEGQDARGRDSIKGNAVDGLGILGAHIEHIGIAIILQRIERDTHGNRANMASGSHQTKCLVDGFRNQVVAGSIQYYTSQIAELCLCTNTIPIGFEIN